MGQGAKGKKHSGEIVGVDLRVCPGKEQGAWGREEKSTGITAKS